MEQDNNSEGPGRQSALVGANSALLRQALAIVTALDDEQFAASPRGLAPHRVGGHLRHIIEFYECFLEGLSHAHIDYDSRRRDESLEHNRQAALTRLQELIHRLESCETLLADAPLFMRAEDASRLAMKDPYTATSISRELVVLSSHTIHHFALIAITLRGHGVMVDKGFGVAPSTLTHRVSARPRVDAAGPA